MIKRKFLIFIISALAYLNLFSQTHFYNTDTIQEIRLYFNEPNWDYILDSLYVKGDKDRLLATVAINGLTYDSVGVRYKGFSSVSVNRIKNPFNIKLDYAIDGQDHEGIDKIKLSNVIQDPSFVREVLSYEIARKYMPSARANYANVYINDSLWGLYTNVESINKDFLENHFEHKYNPFFKCNPENLNVQIGAENSNLSNTHGLDSSDYYPYYDIRSDFGWRKLYNLIDTLNNHVDSIEHILNVDRTLWMHALNYCIINFDSYIGYSQNYYMYYSDARQFNPIMWDFNMSFGGFRLTDASQLYFNGFNIPNAQQMDPLTHYYYNAVSPRPLMKNLFNNERYRKMYLAHIRTIIEENFLNQDYYNRAQHFQNQINLHVQNDTNKFYTYTDFISNLTTQVSLPTSICPGITELMDSRSAYLTNYPGYSGEPFITNISHSPQNVFSGSDLWINAEVSDASYVCVSYRFGKNQRFRTIELYDDGMHNDGLLGDGIYGGKISNCSNSIEYYLYADNDSSGTFSPKRAAFDYYTLTSNINTGDLVINELMSNNLNTITDENNEYEDWIELYNTTNSPISTHGIYLTDTIGILHKWKLPDAVIKPNDYFIIWTDEDGSQGSNHANFKLSNIGEEIILTNSDSSLIDSVTYFSQPIGVSFARLPNGTGPFSLTIPTFNKNNNHTSNKDNNINDYALCQPNPFNNFINVNTNKDIFITDILGNLIYSGIQQTINTTKWKSGIYFIHLKENPDTIFKLVKVH